MGGGGKSQNQPYQCEYIQNWTSWKVESELYTGGRYLQELFNSYGQVPWKGKSTNIIFQSNITEWEFCCCLGFEF